MTGAPAHPWVKAASPVARVHCKIAGLVFAVLATAAVCAREPEPVRSPVVGEPQVVQDLHWGDVLFHFYQGDYLQSLTRLGAAQHFHRLEHHGVEAELLKGGLYLSLGQHEQAGRIFQALLDGNVPLDVRNRAWFYLAKVWYQRNYLREAETALNSIQGALPGDLEPQRHLLQAQVLMYLDRYDEAIAVLTRWQPVGDQTDIWSAYARFNIGVALVRKERVAEAAQLLDAVGQMPAASDGPGDERAALRDKANLALGFAWLKADRPGDAKRVLQRIRLQGPQSNKALLGVGWADSAQQQFEQALVPWLELRDRNMLDAAVQESYLAIPYAYAQLAANRQAVEQYTLAVDAFQKEAARIDQSIAAIRGGRLLDVILEQDKGERAGWYWQLRELPDAPETRYLYHLLASNEFQEGLKNYRDLRLMERNLASWQLSIAAFDDMVGNRREAYARRMPLLQQSLDAVNLSQLEARRTELESRLAAIERDGNAAALATGREQEQWQKIRRIEQALQRSDPNDPVAEEMRQKVRLLRGTLQWDFSAGYKARLWKAHKELRELDVACKEARRRSVLIERARKDYPARTEEFARRVQGLQPRLASLATRLAVAANAQNRYLGAIAIRELTAQKERLAAYSLQARFALASIYDRAAVAPADTQGARQ